MNKPKQSFRQNSQNDHRLHGPFYFVRHGKTDWNKENKVMGQIDVPLNEVGIEQAHVIAQKISHLDISHIVSSTLKRAIQTAEIIAKATNKPITVIEELKNCFSGIMEGQSRGDGKWIEDWRMGGDIKNAEHWSTFISRVAIGLNAARNYVTIDEKPILIVAHGPTYWALLHILNAQAVNVNAENCEVYFFSPSNLDSNRWIVTRIE